MSGVFVYRDNSNIFQAAQDLAEDATATRTPATGCGRILRTCCAGLMPTGRWKKR